MNSKLKQEIREFFETPYDPAAGMGANNPDLWLQMYRGEYPYLTPEVFSLNLAAGVSSELARLATLEMESELKGDLAADYKKLVRRARKFTEYGLALGDIILKPYPAGDKIAVEEVKPYNFLPLGFDSDDRITHISFIDQLVKLEGSGRNQKNVFYIKIEEHKLEGGLYKISNYAFKSEEAGSLGDSIELDTVPEWADLDEALEVEGLTFPLFGHFRSPAPNNLDLDTPLGMSCFSRATSLIQDADEQYSRLLWEYTGGEMAIDADVTALKSSGDLPKHGDRLFRNHGLTRADDGFYEVFAPTLRDSNYWEGLNQILRRVEFSCHLAYGTLSDPNQTDKTAEEIKASKQRSYSMVADIQESLEHALTDLVRAMSAWMEIGQGRVPKDEPPAITFHWDDSLVVDSFQDRQMMLQEVAAGLVKPEYYIQKHYGVPEEDLEAMAKIMPSLDPAAKIDYGEE